MEQIATVGSLKVKARTLRRNQIKDNSSPKKNKKTQITVWVNGFQEIHSFGQDVTYNFLLQLFQEIQHLSREIGYDMESDKQKYWWFFKQLLLTELPSGWEREFDPEGYTLFNNIELNQQTKDHPLRHYFRKLKKEIGAVAKQEAMQGKLSNDFYKRNLNKETVNKLKSDQKVESILGTNDKNKLRFQKLLEIQTNRNERTINYVNLKTMQLEQRDHIISEIEKESLNYYNENFSSFLKTEEICKTFLFKQINMAQILQLSETYGIDVLNESYMLWIPQYLMCLPLPANWKQIKNQETNQVKYIHIIKQIESDFHPIEPFAIVMVKKARQYYEDNPLILAEVKNRLNTYDSMMRQFSVNMNQVRLFYKIQQKKQREQQQKDQSLISRFLTKRTSQESQASSQQENQEITVPEPKLLEEITSEDLNSQANFNSLTSTKSANANLVKDVEIIIVAGQCKVDFEKEIHLLFLIAELIHNISEQTEQSWQFRYINDQNYYWINKKRKTKVTIYPFLSDVIEKVDILRSQTEKLTQNETMNMNCFKDFKLFQGARGQEAIERVKEERSKFTMEVVRQYMNNKENKVYGERMKEFIENDPEFEQILKYDLKPLAQFISQNLSKTQLLDLIYFCPFNLQLQNLKVIDDQLSNINIVLGSSDDDSDISSQYSYSNKNRLTKRIDPRQLIGRSRKASMIDINRGLNREDGSRESAKRRSTIQSQKNLDTFNSPQQTGRHLAPKVKQSDRAQSILVQRKQEKELQEASDKEKQDFKSFFQKQIQEQSLNQMNQKEQQDKNQTPSFKLHQEEKVQPQPENDNFTSTMTQKIQSQQIQENKNSLLANKSSMNLNPSDIHKRFSLIKDASNQGKTTQGSSPRMVSLKQIRISRKNKDSISSVPEKSQQPKFSQINRKGAKINLDDVINDEIKDKVLKSHNHDSILKRFKIQLRRFGINVVKFNRMLSYSQNTEAVRKLKLLVLQHQLIKIIQKQNEEDYVDRKIRQIEKMKRIQRNKIRRDALVMEQQVEAQIEKQQNGIIDLLKIIDKNKFSLDKSPHHNDHDLTFEMFDEHDNLKPDFDYNKIFQDDMGDLNLTFEFTQVVQKFKEFALIVQKNEDDKMMDLADFIFIKPKDSHLHRKHLVEGGSSSLMSQVMEDKDFLLKYQQKLQSIGENIQKQVYENQVLSTFSSHSDSYTSDDSKDGAQTKSDKERRKKQKMEILRNLKHMKGVGVIDKQYLDEYYKQNKSLSPDRSQKSFQWGQRIHLKRENELVQQNEIVRKFQSESIEDDKVENERQLNKDKISKLLGSDIKLLEEKLEDSDSLESGEDIQLKIPEDSDIQSKQNTGENSANSHISPNEERFSSMKKLDQRNKSNVIEEAPQESDDSFDLEKFKTYHLQTNSESMAQMINTIKPYMKQLIKFKKHGAYIQNQKQNDESKTTEDQSENNRDELQKKNRKISLESQKGSKFERLTNATRRQFQKFSIDPETNFPTRKQLTQRIERDQEIDQLINNKRSNFLFYCGILGNPQSEPQNLKFSENFQNMNPFHIIRMGQALGLIQSTRRNDTYLLWIAQQALILPFQDDKDNQLIYEEKIKRIQLMTHPALEYLKYLIYWQRKHFNAKLSKQLNQEKFKKDCSWLALKEQILDTQTQTPIQERTYYYNFYTHSKSLLKPDDLILYEPTQIMFESMGTHEKYSTSMRSSFNLGISQTIDCNKNDTSQQQQRQMSQVNMERTFDRSILNSITSILKKRQKIYQLSIDKIQKKSSQIIVDNKIVKNDRILNVEKKKVKMRWTKSLARYSNQNSQSHDSLPKLLTRSSVIKPLAVFSREPKTKEFGQYTLVGSRLGTPTRSIEGSRMSSRQQSAVTMRILNSRDNKNDSDIQKQVLYQKLRGKIIQQRFDIRKDSL